MAKKPRKKKKSTNKVKRRKTKPSLQKSLHNEEELVIKVSKHWANKAYVNKNSVFTTQLLYISIKIKIKIKFIRL